MRQTRKMVIAAAAAVGAVAGGAVAIANVPVAATANEAPKPAVASQTPGDPSAAATVDPAATGDEAATRAALEKQIAKAERTLERLAVSSPTAAATVDVTVPVISGGRTTAGTSDTGGNAASGSCGASSAWPRMPRTICARRSPASGCDLKPSRRCQTSQQCSETPPPRSVRSIA